MSKALRKRPEGYGLTPRQIIELWCDLELGFDWTKTGPDDLSNGEHDFQEALQKQVWCQRVCEKALSAFCMRSSIAEALVRDAARKRHQGMLEMGYWGRRLGLGGWEIMLGKFEDHVKQAADAIAPPKEVESE